MKKILFRVGLLLTILFNNTVSYSQDTWARVGYGGDITPIKMITPTVGLATGGDGKLLKSTDGGNNWFPFTPVNFNGFGSPCFLDANTGFACGGSIIQKTTDGGNTWVTIFDSPGTFFGALFFLDANNGWAAGASGKIFTTKDGGIHWTDISYNTIDSFRKIYFRNANLGWALTTTEMIHTTDGGNTWTNQFSPTINNIYDFEFTDDNNGFISGSGGFLLNTTNGGAVWTPVSSGVPNELMNISFADANTGWICARGGVIIKTTNGGASWSPQSTGTFEDFYSISTVDANTAVASGRNAQIYKTSNGGTNWSAAGTAFTTTQYNFLSTFFINENVGWAASTFGRISKTSDGGQTWNTQNPGGTSNTFSNIYFINSSEGWVCGFNGAVFHTVDGGTSWNPVSLGTTQSFDGVYFLDANNGWVYNSSLVFHTTNGGASWTSAASPEFIRYMSFTDANNGKVIGISSKLYTTTNGGTAWNLVGGISFTGGFDYVYFNDANTGYAAYSNNEKVFKTINGGLSWSAISLTFSPNSTRSVYFTDNNNGWVVGDGGFIAKTSNAGANWTIQPSSTFALLRAITGRNGVIYAVGGGGTVIKNNFAAALPVRLISFAASLQNNNPYLQWKADNETGFDKYEIERSNNGKDFINIGYRRAATGNGIKQYDFTDNDASLVASNKYYFRLKMVDISGSYTYSKVVSVVVGNRNTMSIRTAPNPFTDKISIQLNLSEAVKVSYKLIDMYGKTILSNAVNVSIGAQALEIEGLKQLPGGIYMLQVRAGNTVFTGKLIK